MFVSKQDQTVHRSKVIDSYGEERESKNGHKYSTSEGLKQPIKACLLKNKIKLVIGANLLTQITRQQIFEFWRAEVDKKRYMSFALQSFILSARIESYPVYTSFVQDIWIREAARKNSSNSGQATKMGAGGKARATKEK